MNILYSPLLRAIFLLAIAAFAGAGCNDNDSHSSSLDEGTFNDGPVSGLDYVSGEVSGKTDADGTFRYDSAIGEETTVTFSVGDIVIGTGVVSPFMTPIDLVPGAENETNDVVTNIARFLQTLDEDADPSNGIQIPAMAAAAATGLSVNFEQSIEDFENDPNVQMVLEALTMNPLVSAEAAQAELRSTILGELAGMYGGSYSGDASGTWAMQVDADGNVVAGSFEVDHPQAGTVTLPVTGTIPSSGVFTLGAMVETFTLTLEGSVSLAGAVTGVWTLTDSATEMELSGTFSGAKDFVPGDGGSGDFTPCSVEGLPGRMVRFEFTPDDQSGPFTENVCAAFECQVEGGFNCALQVFDIAGSDRFFQFLTTDTQPFPVNTNLCFGFDAVIQGPSFAIITFGDLTGRQFGASTTEPFATGTYAERFPDFSSGESLGTFRFFEYGPDDGYKGFMIPAQDCEAQF